MKLLQADGKWRIQNRKMVGVKKYLKIWSEYIQHHLHNTIYGAKFTLHPTPLFMLLYGERKLVATDRI